MNTRIAAAGVIALCLFAPACTDLTEVPQSAITPENFYRNQVEVIGGLASVYAQLRSTNDDYYNLSEITTDEMIVPTRGSDWYDNGQWLDIHRQTFTANSPAALSLINGAWINLFQGVARANVVLGGIANVNFTSKPTVTAELRTLRAWYYFLLMDFFGGVPIVTDASIAARPRNTRQEVFNFVESELKAARPDLPAKWSADMNGRVTQGTVDAMLASLYLNAAVFNGTVSAAGLQFGTARWQDALNAANAVISSGQYALATDANMNCSTVGCGWRKNFSGDNYNSPEIIFAVKYAPVSGLGLNFLMRALHYNQYTPSPWNGFATLADTYYAFDSKDQRTQIFLAGPQFNVLTGQPVNDRQGNRLVFNPLIPDVTAASEGAGVRIMKWPPDPNAVQQDNGNDYAFFRLGEIYLIRAEAENELGQTAAAIADINVVRARAFSPPNPVLTTLTQQQVRDAILNERLFELTAEGKRRQDLIRFNKFTQGTWYAKTSNAPHKVLMPIPQPQIDANPKLQQNPGYSN
jgi:hypothetical protein